MTSTATSTQINVRIDRQLKDTGDAALLAAGITPSQAIRMLWDRAAELKDDPAALSATLFPPTSSGSDDRKSRRAKLAELALDGQMICVRARSESGIVPAVEAGEQIASDAELYTEELYERYAERWSL